MRTKYPRTPHLPWSPGATADDARVRDVRSFEGREVVVTEKLDGENTTLYRDGLHARSLDSAHHPSRSWVKMLHGRVASRIPDGWRVCGESVLARHSISYGDLESFFYAFSVWTDRGSSLSWDDTVRFATRLGVPTPRVLWRGVFDERAIRKLRVDRDRVEGYVVRLAGAIPFEAFGESIGKWVRSGHVTTDEHWMMAEVVPNELGARAALWDVRSGGDPDVAALSRVVGLDVLDGRRASRVAAAALDVAGRGGDARLAGVLAAMLCDVEIDASDRHRDEAARSWLMPRLAPAVGARLARKVADLVGRRGAASWEVPDAERVATLRRLARGTDVATLLALGDANEPEARERAALFELFAEEAGVLDEAPFERLRSALDEALRAHDEDERDFAWARTLDRFCDGRIASPDEALALAHPRAMGEHPSLVVTVGPSGSGKSSFVDARYPSREVIALDELRAGRGSRADQSRNEAVLREAAARLEDAMRRSARVVWDATALDARQRAIPLRIARRYGAFVTYAVMLTPDDELPARNRDRAHSVPEDVIEAQLRRRVFPYAGEADRILYVGAEGSIADVSGSLSDREHAAFGGGS